MAREFKLPELGENIESGDVVKVLVSKGDTVSADQPVLELETEKATIEVPVPFGGTVSQVNVKEGDKVKVGDVVLAVDEEGKAAPKEEAKEPEEKKEEKVEAKAKPEPRPEKKEAKPAAEEAKEEEEEPEEPARAAAPTRPQVVEFERRAAARATEAAPARGLVPAAPSVRREARELGVDISQVPGSGPGGRISVEDVKNYVKALVARTTTGARAAGAPAAAAAPLPDFSRWGEVERQPMSAVRRKTAAHMATAWTTIPHVTQYDKADITQLEKLRKQFSAKVEKSGGKLTVTAVLLKVVASALKTFPQFNASVDAEREEIVLKKYCHIGVAVDTERGLLVPVIRDVDKKNIGDLSAELAEMAERARNRKLGLEDMQGGTFTITNLGGIGGTYFSPIVNYPEVAILGVSRSTQEPVWKEGMYVPRLMLPLSLSYDHRVIDGADAARFLRWVAEALEQPFLLSLEG